MATLYQSLLILVLFAGCARSAAAQEQFEKQTRPDAITSTQRPATLTGKERLGRKWTDEQRIDNCKVPIDKRGTKPRPGVCPHDPAS